MNDLILKLTQKAEHNLEILKDGVGSGNFGHSGRKGFRGGSGKSGSASKGTINIPVLTLDLDRQ